MRGQSAGRCHLVTVAYELCAGAAAVTANKNGTGRCDGEGDRSAHRPSTSLPKPLHFLGVIEVLSEIIDTKFQSVLSIKFRYQLPELPKRCEAQFAAHDNKSGRSRR